MGPKITETVYEIWARSKGRLASEPCDFGASMNQARELAAWHARGDLLDHQGNKPSKTIFELEPGESLSDFHEDGLYIREVKVVKEASCY
jgi:hypothetical protein